MQTIGLVLQVLGLVATAVGIGTAWAENARPDDSLTARVFGPPIRWVWTKLLGQKPRGGRRHLGSADGAFGFESSATGLATRALQTDAPIGEQVQQVKQEVDQAQVAAAVAQAAADRALSEVERTRAYVDRQDAAVQDAIQKRLRAETVDGIPLAVVGLTATILGTLVQYVGGFLG